jgi:putative tryptophan/tyrosine transport system substrate-binding protein
VIVSGGSAATGPVKKATGTIPIVMTNDPDPVANGFVASLARPGGNVTGLATLSPAISGKRLEILNEIVPKLSRVAVFGSLTEPNDAQAFREVELAAKALGIKLRYMDVLASKDVESGFTVASNERADALLVLSGAGFVFQLKRVAELAAKNRLPAIYHRSEFVEAGGLMSYAASLTTCPVAPHFTSTKFSRCRGCGSPCRTADEIRIGHQSESCQADRLNHSTQCAGQSG